MIEVRQTETYARWFNRLSDKKAQARINTRIRRLSLGNPGDVKPLGGGVSELRIDYGPATGYILFSTAKNKELTILLAGGDKNTQERDIEKAIKLAGMLQEG